jgi:hypothetical protein
MLSGTRDGGRKLPEAGALMAGLSFKSPRGMVTLEFFSGNQAHFEGNPA